MTPLYRYLSFILKHGLESRRLFDVWAARVLLPSPDSPKREISWSINFSCPQTPVRSFHGIFYGVMEIPVGDVVFLYYQDRESRRASFSYRIRDRLALSRRSSDTYLCESFLHYWEAYVKTGGQIISFNYHEFLIVELFFSTVRLHLRDLQSNLSHCWNFSRAFY